MVSRKKSLDGFSFFVFIIEVSAESCRFFSFLEKNSFPFLLKRTRLCPEEPILASWSREEEDCAGALLGHPVQPPSHLSLGPRLLEVRQGDVAPHSPPLLLLFHWLGLGLFLDQQQLQSCLIIIIYPTDVTFAECQADSVRLAIKQINTQPGEVFVKQEL